MYSLTLFWRNNAGSGIKNCGKSHADNDKKFLQCGGNFKKLLTYANMSPGETNSIACKTFELIARTVPIDSKIFGGNVEI